MNDKPPRRDYNGHPVAMKTGVRVMADEFMNIVEAAEYLDVHPETIRRMIKRKDNALPADLIVVNGRAQWRIRVTDLDKAEVYPPHRPPSSNET